MDKTWHITDRLDADVWQHLLKHRGLDDAAYQVDFFNPDLAHLTPPKDFPDIDAAVGRIRQAMAEGQPVVVWGDFDADGVTATAIMWETLHELGANVMPYIPNRDSEGHGFNRQGLESLAAAGTRLIITVDHGVTAFDDIEAAKSLGIDIVVTDHHEPAPAADLDSSQFSFPQAVAIIHPFRLPNEQRLAGCGVAYQLAYAVWLDQLQRHDTLANRALFAAGRIELTALGTIADLMPLQGDNRIFASLGLRNLTTTKRVGLQQLLKVAGISTDEQLSVYQVGFLIGPRLNAPGRLADALASLRLLCVKGESKGRELAAELDSLNKQRQELLLRVVQEAKQVLEARPGAEAYILKSKDWPAGVCGLAAGKLVEQVYRPVVVMEDQGELCRGSARSIKGFDITAALTSMADVLESFGGHAMAAGFVAKTAAIPEIERRLSEAVAAQLSPEQLMPVMLVEAEVGLAELSLDLVHRLQQLEPCGMGNPQPIFVARGLQVEGSRVIGKDAKHLKLLLSDQHKSIEAIAFGFGHMADPLAGGQVDVVFGLEENVWNGRTSLQINIKDIKLRS